MDSMNSKDTLKDFPTDVKQAYILSRNSNITQHFIWLFDGILSKNITSVSSLVYLGR